MTAATEAAGLFGPGSVSWRIDREVVVLAGGSCALLMQAAHPVVAAGVAEHSSYATDPFGRLLRTLVTSYEFVFGSLAEADAALRRVNAIHAGVRGRLPGTGQAYAAMDPEALLWVHATLVDTALRVYSRFVSPLTPSDEQAYYVESSRVAQVLGVRPSDLPPTIADVRAWMTEMIASRRVHVTPAARNIARTVLYPTRFPPRLAWDAAHLVSLSALPPALRRQYGIRWSARRERGVEWLARASRVVVPWLPSPVRHAPQARAADRRVRRARQAAGGS
ncbi:MAG: oxygenase MpaB family protein [Chloroflexota bacterium]